MTDRSFGDHTERSVVKNPLLSTAVVGLSLEDLTHNAILLPVARNPGLISSQNTQTLKHATDTLNQQSGDASNHTFKPKPDANHDDFDVTEYIARLQGSRYVSAPINAPLNQNTDLPIDNLEEVNLNEASEEPAQSLTSDIAQNFSQLPQVLPQVASAVFSSFSNMLNISRRDEKESKEVGGGVMPQMAQPPTEPPLGSSSNTFRITTKKKAYAQIPGLSSNETVQAPSAFSLPPASNQPSYFVPKLSNEQPIAPSNPEQHSNSSVSNSNVWSPPEISSQANVQSLPKDETPVYFTPPQEFASKSESVSLFTPVTSLQDVPEAASSELSTDVSVFSTPSSLSINSSYAPSSTVIPPPPTTFSSSTRNDNQIKTLLPPSVARRLSQPNKSQINVATFGSNIFIPTAISEDSSKSITDGISIQSDASRSMFSNVTPSASLPPDFSSGDNLTAQVPMFFDPASIASSSVAPTHSTALTVPPIHTTSVDQTALPISNLPPTISANTMLPPATIPPIGPIMLEPPKQLFDPAKIIASIPEPQKPTPEPPKITTGNVNFRMGKKRPQYYSGPIQGVGSISNNIKPLLAPLDTSQTFQGAMFIPQSVPEPEISSPVASLASAQTKVPFDLSRPAEVNLSSDQYSFNQNQYGNLPQQQYNTLFDMSRQTTDTFEEPKQESKGFGIIGSLKSKLTSLDINKIQSSVTTFFDPAYNADKHGVGINQENQPYSDPNHGRDMYQLNQFSSLEINVPNQNQHNYRAHENSQQNINYNQYYQPMQQYGYQNQAENTPISTSNYSQSNAYFSSDSIQSSNQGSFSNNLVGVFDTSSQKQPLPNAMTSNYFGQQLTNENQGFRVGFDPSNQQCQSYYSEPTSDKKFQSNTTVESQDLLGKTVDVASEAKDYKDASNQTNQQDSANVTDVSSNKATASLFRMSSAVGFNRQEMNELQCKVENVNINEPINLLKQNSASFFDNFNKSNVNSLDEELTKQKDKDLENHESNFNICETCREVNQPEREDADFTKQLIENITSPIQLSNSVEVPLTETAAFKDNASDFESSQCRNISHITEETMETIQIQSAIEYLDKKDMDRLDNTLSYDIDHPDVTSYGWCDNFKAEEPNSNVSQDHEYNFQTDPNVVGFCSNNSLFFENIPNNASDEIKAEFKNAQDDSPTNIVTREISIPSAPPIEDLDETKSDETGGIDVQLIEQDAKTDFDFEEFVIEPSETDDDKIEVKERERTSEDPVADIDSFTNRIEKFKHLGESVDTELTTQTASVPTSISPAITIASYFDTGNYAAETHYKKSLSSPTSINIFNLPAPSPMVSAFTAITPFQQEDLSASKELSSNLFNPPLPFMNPISPTVIPDTSTQTSVTSTVTISTNIKHLIAEEIAIGAVLPDVDLDALIPGGDTESKVKLPGFSSVFHNPVVGSKIPTTTVTTALSRPVVSEKQAVTAATHSTFVGQQASKTVGLEDPMNFFSTAAVAKNENKEESGAGFNRLASYFATPATTTDHTKSFFELSQGQDHLRKEADSQKTWEATQSYKSFFDANSIPQEEEEAKTKHKSFFELSQNHKTQADQYMANVKLMEDLTSTKYYNPTAEQVVKTVNYFMIQLDNPCLGTSNIAKSKDDSVNNVDLKQHKPLTKEAYPDKSIDEEINDCKYCCNDFKVAGDEKLDVTKQIFQCKQCMDGKSSSEGSDMSPTKTNDPTSSPQDVSVNLTMEERNQENVSIVDDNRQQTDYVPVKHHWFYRVDLEEKSTWKGFSDADSGDLERAFLSPELNESTVVATDGGRYDVNVMGRLRLPVYWIDKPTNVRRCSWFYKGTTDARYVPYTEPIADKLEEEYRHGLTTGVWHRRLVLPRSEVVVMHAPGVMVHLQQGGAGSAADAWGGPASFLFGNKTVYRNPNITVAKDQVKKIDHLLMLVHGAGEGRRHRYKLQATMRPRVVRRGCEESEIEELEPSKIDHLLLLCHGVGSACDMRFRSVEDVVDDFRATSSQLIQGHYKNSYENGTVGRIEVLPISWHATLHSGESGVDKRLARISLQSIPMLRGFTNDTVLDVLFYTSPAFCQTIVETVCKEINRIYALFRSRNPQFSGGVSLGGHSLGSVILYDLLCHQGDDSSPTKTFINDSASTGMPHIKYPKLDFHPACLYALGSPIAMFECIRGVELLGEDFKLPTCNKFFNIFHPYDPIAYRIEPLINTQLQDAPPSLIPHHKGRKRMHLELKETVARVGADLKQRLVESLKSTWSSMWRAQEPASLLLEQVVEEELEKEALNENEDKQDQPELNFDALKLVGKLNAGQRVDYVLQEAPFEMINEYLFAMSSHVCYWESEDTMLLMLREMYSSVGVCPDSTLPAQSLTVQRTRLLTADDEGTSLTAQANSAN